MSDYVMFQQLLVFTCSDICPRYTSTDGGRLASDFL